MSLKGIPQSSTLNRDAKALVNRTVQSGRGTKTVKSARPMHQIVEHNHQPVYYTNSFRSVPLNLFRNSGARYSGNIEQKSFTKMKSATLKITVTVRNTQVNTENCYSLTPVTHWFDRIEVRSNNGSNHLGIMRSDQLAFNLNMLPNDKLPSVLKNCNLSLDSWTTPNNTSLEKDTQATFFLPLVGSYLDINQYFANIQGDIVLDFVPSNNIISDNDISGGSIDCDSMELIIETENLTNEDEKAHELYHNSVISSNRTLDFVPVIEYNKVLTANSVSTIDLDSVVGKTAGIVLMVKQTGATNEKNQSSSYVDLGDSATIDLQTSGGKSILGSGVPLTGQYIKNELWNVHFDTQYSQNRNAYFIPFTGDCRSALKGQIDGYLDLNSSGHKLQIKPAPVGKTAVQKIYIHQRTQSTVDAGQYYIEFMGERTITLLPSHTTAYMKSVTEALSTMRNYKGGPLTVDFNRTVAFGFTISATLKSGVTVSEPIKFVNLTCVNSTGEQVGFSTFTNRHKDIDTRQGTSGFISGTYDVHAYALVYRDIHSHQGKISTELS
jgi:hypothetical protein